MQIKVVVEGFSPELIQERDFETLYDAMDEAREFLDFGYIVTVIINGASFRVLRDSGIIRSIPISSDGA